MKIKDLIKQLNAIKKAHGDLNCELLDGVTDSFSSIKSLSLIYPYGKDGCYDRTQKPWGVWIDNSKH